MKPLLLALTLSFVTLTASGQKSTQPLQGTVLLDSIHTLIQPIRVLGYGGGHGKTWSGFYRTDMIDGGIVRDRYSDKTYYHRADSTAVDGMNIEHIWANSWWGHLQNFAYKDLFNLYPSDAEANQRKSNNPIGVVDGSIAYQNGVVKIGKSSSYRADSLITVFEPADEWKGDFARTYFYMATVYKHFATEGLWTTAEGLLTVDPTSPLVMRPWVYQLMLQWHRQDPVSQIERDRCDSIEWIQGNRNPFVDFPALSEYIWGDSTTCTFDLQRIRDRKNPDIHVVPDPDPATKVTFTMNPDALRFSATPGQSSTVAKVTPFMNNVTLKDFTVSATAPFQVSTDGQSWQQDLTLTYTTAPFYVRFQGQPDAGLYESEIVCTHPEGGEKIISVTADVDTKYTFFENFEIGTKGGYALDTITCNATRWIMNNALISSTEAAKNGEKSLRMKGTGTLTMLTPHPLGCDSLSFWTALYNKDTGMKITVEYSLDDAQTWTPVVTAAPVSTWQRSAYYLGIQQPLLLRFTAVGPSNKRLNLDDIQMTPYGTTTGIDDISFRNEDDNAFPADSRRAAKVLVGPHLYIHQGGRTYTPAGVRISK